MAKVKNISTYKFFTTPVRVEINTSLLFKILSIPAFCAGVMSFVKQKTLLIRSYNSAYDVVIVYNVTLFTNKPLKALFGTRYLIGCCKCVCTYISPDGAALKYR